MHFFVIDPITLLLFFKGFTDALRLQIQHFKFVSRFRNLGKIFIVKYESLPSKLPLKIIL